MQKRLFGAFIGAILVFGWQAMSHMVMLHHNMGMKQVPGQDALLPEAGWARRLYSAYFLKRR